MGQPLTTEEQNKLFCDFNLGDACIPALKEVYGAQPVRMLTIQRWRQWIRRIRSGLTRHGLIAGWYQNFDVPTGTGRPGLSVGPRPDLKSQGFFHNIQRYQCQGMDDPVMTIPVKLDGRRDTKPDPCRTPYNAAPAH